MRASAHQSSRFRRTSSFVLAITVIAGMLGSLSPATAIIGGVEDGGGHPYVGMVVFYDAAGVPTHRCSGTLLTSRVLLTAGHCTDGTASARVWFDASISTITSGGTAGTPFTHPDYVGADFSSPDVGVVLLAKQVRMSTYGTLPPAGIVDGLATVQGSTTETHTIVGYGLQQVKPNLQRLFTRYRGSVAISGSEGDLGVGDDFVQITSYANAHWSGGVCSGDSGGPLFLHDTNVVLGVTSFGEDPNCRGASGEYRLDVDSARSFLADFVAVP